MAWKACNAGRWEAMVRMSVEDPATSPIGDSLLLSDDQIQSDKDIGIDFADQLTPTVPEEPITDFEVSV